MDKAACSAALPTIGDDPATLEVSRAPDNRVDTGTLSSNGPTDGTGEAQGTDAVRPCCVVNFCMREYVSLLMWRPAALGSLGWSTTLTRPADGGTWQRPELKGTQQCARSSPRPRSRPPPRPRSVAPGLPSPTPTRRRPGPSTSR